MEQGQDLIILPDGLHLWNPATASLGAIPDDIIERQSAGYSLHPMDNPEWRKITTDSMVVMGDVPDQALRTLAVTAEKLDEMLHRELGGPERRYVYKIRIFQDRLQFCSYVRKCGGSNALSLYDPNGREIVLYFGPETGKESFEQTFAHEMTHAYMHLVYNVLAPLWLAEGMAEYFSLVKWTAKGYKPTGRNWYATIHLKAKRLFPLRDILLAGRNDVYGIEAPQYFVQCWGLVHFLIKNHPKVVEALLQREFVDLSPISDDYTAYLKKLIR